MPDNRKPLIYGSFPVCRNYTVRAHVRNLGTTEWRRCKNGVLDARPLRCGIHPPHLHPRHKAEAGRSRTNDGQLHGAGHVSRKKAQKYRREGKASSPVLFDSFRTFRCVGHSVGQQLTHILARTIFGVFATKKHRKPKFSMLFGAAGQIRTADLILTKDALYRLSYSSKWRPGRGSNPRPPA